MLVYDRYGAIGELALVAGAVIALADQAATRARFVGGELVVASGGTAIESFTISGSTSGLQVRVASGSDGQTLLIITSGAVPGSLPHGLLEAAARFGDGSTPSSPASRGVAMDTAPLVPSPKAYAHQPAA